MNWTDEFKDKKIVIWGFGKEGESTYNFIRRLLPSQPLTIADSSKKDLAFLQKEANVTLIDDAQIDFDAYDMVIKSPGIVFKNRFDIKRLTSQTELFVKHYRDHIIGVTGTKGKSTTTSLLYTILKQKLPTVLVGNIGIPCFDAIEKMEKGYYAAFEMSCHQLEYISVSPKYAIFLNLFEEHLDHYGTFENYAKAKSHIFTYQSSSDTLIIDDAIHHFDDKIVARTYRIHKDIDVDANTIKIGDRTIPYPSSTLIGKHNYLNIAVAYTMAKILGLNDEEILKGIANFQPLHHRLENIGVYKGIRYINDSISTIGQATIQAISSIPEVDVVLVGGMDRGIHYGELESFLYAKENIQVILMYATGERIYRELQEKGMLKQHIHLVSDLEEAMILAKKLAKHTVLLSPAASSYDHFKNFEERGEVFTSLAKTV